jgi:hypothetical protein
MSYLSKVTTGIVEMPHLILIHGVDGVGKTSFGAGAPNPIFLGPEAGTNFLDSVTRLPAPDSWNDVVEQTTELINANHNYKTLVVDSVDWLEPMLWRHICESHGTPKKKINSIEDVGFGKGYVKAVEAWVKWQTQLTDLRKKGLNIVLICHSGVRAHDNTQLQVKYDRYEIKLHKGTAARFREFADTVLFANYETFTKEDDTGKVRAFGEGNRVVYTEHRPAFDAKNRANLPFQFELGWENYTAALSEARAAIKNPDVIVEEIEGLLTNTANEELKTQVRAAVKAAGRQSVKLLTYKEKLLERLENEKKGDSNE